MEYLPASPAFATVDMIAGLAEASKFSIYVRAREAAENGQMAKGIKIITHIQFAAMEKSTY